jgi:hypothetical protein
MTMWIRLRQIAIVADDLRTASLDLGDVLGLEPCFTDPGVRRFGLKNMLWPVGTQFIEVVTPIAPGTAAGRYLDRRHGNGGYMVINQVDDIAPRRHRAEQLGVRVAFDLNFPEQGHDGIQLHPADTGGSFFEMDQMTGPDGNTEGGPWYPAGPNWQPYVRTDRVDAIIAAELQSPDPQRLAQRWADIAEVDLIDESDHLRIRFDNADIRFVEATDGRGEGLGGIDVRTIEPAGVLTAADRRGIRSGDDQVMIAGLRVNLVDASSL